MSIILTYTGRHIDLLSPNPAEFNLVDIAHALSQINRFTGHTAYPYSVAQHSVLCARLVPQEHQLEALFHDAHEAYTGDVTSPLKALLPDYRELEDRMECAMRGALHLPAVKSAIVKHADLVMLATERRDLMPQDSSPWNCLVGIEPDYAVINPWQPTVAAAEFITMALRLIPEADHDMWIEKGQLHARA